MITYNHEAYIKQAIEGILMQQTNFDVELIIADDCSTDRTEPIIRELIENHSENFKIKYYRHAINIGMMPNFIFSLKSCTGKYIALCEGDDYWTDPLKLQKQIDFLEANEDYNLCFHTVSIYNQAINQIESDTITREINETTEAKDLAEGNYIHTPSVLFRNNIEIPSWFSKTPLGDWTLYMLVVQGGKIFKMEDTMAVYRKHFGGVWSTKSKAHRIINTIESFNLVKENLSISKETKQVLVNKINNFKQQLAKNSF